MSFDIETLKKKDLLLYKEAAFWLGCSERTIYRLLEEGKLQAFKDGNRTRIIRASIEEYINSHQLDPSI